MKKIIMSVAVVAGIVFGVFQANNNNNLSELELANVEALAESEKVNLCQVCSPMSGWYCILETPTSYIYCFNRWGK